MAAPPTKTSGPQKHISHSTRGAYVPKNARTTSWRPQSEAQTRHHKPTCPIQQNKCTRCGAPIQADNAGRLLVQNTTAAMRTWWPRGWCAATVAAIAPQQLPNRSTNYSRTEYRPQPPAPTCRLDCANTRTPTPRKVPVAADKKNKKNVHVAGTPAGGYAGCRCCWCCWWS